MMDQEMDLTQAYGYDESVWSVLGPMGPIATYHRPSQLSQTIPSGQSHSSHAQARLIGGHPGEETARGVASLQRRLTPWRQAQ